MSLHSKLIWWADEGYADIRHVSVLNRAAHLWGAP